MEDVVYEFIKREGGYIELFAGMAAAKLLLLDNHIANYGYEELQVQTQVYRNTKSDYEIGRIFLDAKEFYDLMGPP
jgi:hypothetical protein